MKLYYIKKVELCQPKPQFVLDEMLQPNNNQFVNEKLYIQPKLQFSPYMIDYYETGAPTKNRT